MKRVLVTGASGFIGRHSLAPLAAKGYEVHAVSEKGRDTDATAVWHRADLLDQGDRRELLARVHPSHLLHFAWYAVPGKYWTAPENLDWVAASLALLRGFVEEGGQRALFAGSCAEYDWSHGLCSEANTPLVPATLYGASKHALQTLLRVFAGQAGLSAAWGRIFSLYGPHESPSRLAASVIIALLRNEPAQCSEGSQIRDYLHVADVASAFVALLDSAVEGAVNIGSGRGIAIRELVGRIGRQTGRAELIRHGALPLAAGEPSRLVADVARLRDEVGWSPHYDLDAGLADTIAFWRRSSLVASAAR